MNDRTRKGTSRRKFITLAGKGVAASAAAVGFPSIVPASVFGAFSPSNRINVGAIGTGRISRAHDLPGIWRHDIARIMAVCDLDGKRVQDAKALINEQYAKKKDPLLRRSLIELAGFDHGDDLQPWLEWANRLP